MCLSSSVCAKEQLVGSGSRIILHNSGCSTHTQYTNTTLGHIVRVFYRKEADHEMVQDLHGMHRGLLQVLQHLQHI